MVNKFFYGYLISILCAHVSGTIAAATPSFQAASVEVPMKTLWKIARKNSVPLGIVSASGDALCTERSIQEPAAGSPLDEARAVLADTGYQAALESGVLSIRPKFISPVQKRILTLTFPQWGGEGINFTWDGYAVLLNSVIEEQLHPTGGYAGSILGSPGQQRGDLPLLKNPQVQQIADQIGASFEKGVWLLPDYSDSELEQLSKSGGNSILFYSFADYREGKIPDFCAAIRRNSPHPK